MIVINASITPFRASIGEAVSSKSQVLMEWNLDNLDKEQRSDNMRRIRHKDTKPELIVRKIVTSLGYRYRIHLNDLPGKPDLTFRRLKRVIFVHGCFWHQHAECREGRFPKTRGEYWKPKLQRNVERDRSHLASLAAGGWRAMVIWECEVSNADLNSRIKSFLESEFESAANA